MHEVSCEGIDNEEEEFWFIFNKDSEEGAGVGRARYVEGTNKYKIFIGKICLYAINYLQGGFFYKQICNLEYHNYNFLVRNYLDFKAY